MDYNPFRSGRATQQTVQEGELEMLKRNVNNPGQSDAAKKKMKDRIAQLQAKPKQEQADDDTVRMMKANPSMMKKGGPGGMKGLNKKAQKDVKKAMKDDVNESKFVIPEEIPANERTAFHGAAAAAAKAGKSHFNFGGKKHPVTMKKDTAKAISDDVKEGMYKDMDTEKSEPNPRSDDKVKADFKKRRNMKKEKAAGGGKEGDVEMNPKMDSGKSEQKESKIRSALKSVLAEKKHDDHYKGTPPGETAKDMIKGKGAEDMMKGAQDEIAKGPDAHLDEPEMIKKDRAKMTSNVKKSAMRKNDNPKGDSNIVPSGTPMKDPIAMKAESYDKTAGIKAAYAAMYETETEEIEEVKDAD